MFFSNTSFLLVYKGDLICTEEADRRDEEYEAKKLFPVQFCTPQGQPKTQCLVC